MKKKIVRSKENSAAYRQRILNYYNSKFFNLFMSSYKWTGFTREEREFIMRRFWRDGKVAAFRITDELLGFAPFAPIKFNIYNTPTEVQIVQLRGVTYLPKKPLKTGSLRLNVARNVEEPEVVIGYAQHNLMPIAETIAPLIDQIVETEMTLRTNIFAQKLPILYATTPENKGKMDSILEDIFNDELNIAVDISEVQNITSLSSNPPYIADKLLSRIESLENKILTFLGIDNSGKMKAERQGVDEVNANNELINDYQEAVLANLEEFVELVNEAFGTSYAVEAKSKPVDSFHEPNEAEKGEEDDSSI